MNEKLKFLWVLTLTLAVLAFVWWIVGMSTLFQLDRAQGYLGFMYKDSKWCGISKLPDDGIPVALIGPDTCELNAHLLGRAVKVEGEQVSCSRVRPPGRFEDVESIVCLEIFSIEEDQVKSTTTN